MNAPALSKPKRRPPRAPEVPARPIRDERDYDDAIAKLDHLMLLPRPTRAEESLRDILLVLVEAWERVHEPLPNQRRVRLPGVSVRPIMSERDYDEASKKLMRLVLLPRPTPEEAALMEVLTVLVEAWERVHEPLDLESVTPAGTIEFLMEQHGMSRADLGRVLGDRSVASAILNGRRSPSKNHIRILAEHFHVSPALFL